MNLRNDPRGIHLVLSRRNLETLIKLLDNRVGIPGLHRTDDNSQTFFVTAEENDIHYNSEDRSTRMRGRMGIGPEDVPERLG